MAHKTFLQFLNKRQKIQLARKIAALMGMRMKPASALAKMRSSQIGEALETFWEYSGYGEDGPWMTD
jgi:hypothetical protein